MKFEHSLLERPYSPREVRELLISMNQFIQKVCMYTKKNSVDTNGRKAYEFTFPCLHRATHRLAGITGSYEVLEASGNHAMYCHKHAVRLAEKRNTDFKQLLKDYPNPKSPQLKKMEDRPVKTKKKKKKVK